MKMQRSSALSSCR